MRDVAEMVGVRACVNCGGAFRPAKSWQRFCSTRCRQAHDRSTAGTRPKNKPRGGAYVPSARLRPLLAGYSVRELEVLSGIQERTIRALMHGERDWTAFRVADRLITAVDGSLWHLPAELGGLADLYETSLREQARVCDSDRSPDANGASSRDDANAATSAVSSGWSSAERHERTVMASSLERVRPDGGRQRHLRRKGESKVFCGIDSATWKQVLVENREPVTCPWCEQRRSAK